MAIQREDFKAKRTTLEFFRNIDTNAGVPLVPTTMSELLETNRHDGSITRYDFEVKRYGVIENILGEYIAYLTNPPFLNRVFFKDYQANHLKYNINALSHVLYGDINMAWTISFLNDLIKHPSDLTTEVMIRDGILAFNKDGIDAIKRLLKFKDTNEQNEGNGDREALFTLDSF